MQCGVVEVGAAIPSPPGVNHPGEAGMVGLCPDKQREPQWTLVGSGKSARRDWVYQSPSRGVCLSDQEAAFSLPPARLGEGQISSCHLFILRGVRKQSPQKKES